MPIEIRQQQPQMGFQLQFITEDGKRRSQPSKVSTVRSHVRKLAVDSKKRLNDASKPTSYTRSLRPLPQTETPPTLPSPQTLLGAGKTDPFSSYPIPGEPWIDGLISHYVTIYQIAAVKGKSNAFSWIVSDWIPLCMKNELAFLSLLLYTEIGISVRHLYGAKGSPWTIRAVNLSTKCTTLLRQKIKAATEPPTQTSSSITTQKRSKSVVTDAVIASVVNMALIELFLTRNLIAYEAHRRGLAHLLKLRGGIDELHGSLKILASKAMIGGDSFGSTTAAAAKDVATNNVVKDSTNVPNGVVENSRNSAMTEEEAKPTPLTYNKVLDILAPEK